MQDRAANALVSCSLRTLGYRIPAVASQALRANGPDLKSDDPQHKISLGRSDILSERPATLAIIPMSRPIGIDGMLKQAPGSDGVRSGTEEI